MARKQTALEASQGRSDNREQVRRLGLTLALALALAGAIACLVQAVQVSRAAAAVDSLEQSRKALVVELTQQMAAAQTAMGKALSDPTLRGALGDFGREAQTRASLRLRQLVPDLVRAEFFPPELPQLIEADLQKFGYGRANMLAEARDAGGIARAQLVREDDGTLSLGLSQAIVEGTNVLGYAYVLRSGAAFSEQIESMSFAGGRLSLRQGMVGAVISESRGKPGGAEDRALPIPQSILSVGMQRSEFFDLGDVLPILDSRSPLALGITGVLLLLMAAGLGAVRALRIGVPMVPAAKAAAGLLGRFRKPVAGDASDAIMPPMDQPKAIPVKVPAVKKPAVKPVSEISIDRSIFRAYDIRGVVGASLTPDTVRLIGKAVGSAVRERGLNEVVVARDGRLSGAEFAAELIKGLRSTGCDVIDIGMAPTPVLYFATYHLNAGSGVMVTGSHNPPDYNGFKIMIGGETLAEDSIQQLYTRIAENNFAVGSGGLQVIDVVADYIERITGDVQAERPLKVVVDCGNGVAGGIAPQVLETIGCEVVPLHCEVDGKFPNHHPDPSDPANLKDLIVSVKRLDADIGLAFDGDGDRLGVVTRSGEIIYPDRLLMLFAMDVLNRNPGATVIYDVKCTGHLQDVILRHGGSPVMWKTGHSLIKAKMREEEAELAGEMSGHFFFRERWFGFDDAIYAAARLMEILGASPRDPQAVFDELPKGVSTPELKIATAEGAHYAFVNTFRETATFPGARITTIDGVRADYPDGWGLVRASNTTPNLVLRFDADDHKALIRIQDVFRAQMLAQEPNLKLPF